MKREGQPGKSAPRRGRPWVWYFVLLAVLAAVAITVPIIYNLRTQLTPGQLAEAKQRWRENGPADYDLRYLERLGDDPVGDEYLVQVRGGEVRGVFRNGTPVPAEELSAVGREAYAVPGLFAQIEQHLKEDLRDGRRRNYATAFFDRRTGYPVRYVRRLKGTRERLEWTVKLQPRRGQGSEVRGLICDP